MGKGEITCEICGRPIAFQGSGRPPSKHPGCRRFDSYLNAAERELMDMNFSSPFFSAMLRRRLIGLLNRYLQRFQVERGKHGTAGGERSPESGPPDHALTGERTVP